GVGEARYKELICNNLDPLFDCFIGLSPAGRLFAAAARLGAITKRAIKQNPTLWSLVNTARRLRSRL
ncbi:MAG: GNAT family N-acetyltransferase, partial [Pseudolabrys sp.]|nr:GNAT family N-acetyltransferase [Pseudolabrys sp.]